MLMVIFALGRGGEGLGQWFGFDGCVGVGARTGAGTGAASFEGPR
jgi:hypothetical protein